MKVITQLIKHFWQRGSLAADEADYLVDHGFIRSGDLPGYKKPTGKAGRRPASPDVATHDNQSLAEDAWYHSAEQMEVALCRRRATRRRKRGEIKRDCVSLDELCARVNGEFQRRGRSLVFVLDLAAALGPAGNWQEAAGSLRRATDHEFWAAISRVFRSGGRLHDAWAACDMEPFHWLLAKNEVRARAARAFRALLLVAEPASLGKYAWILKRNEMQLVLNLQSMRRRLLVALNELYHREWRLLTLAVGQCVNPVAVWAMVLLHNANRLEPAAQPLSGATDYGPIDPPTDEIWQQAWTAALKMDHVRVMRLLMACYSDAAARGARKPNALSHDLCCPIGWHLPSKELSGD
jgi:hypothetical protein